ncbi:MAG: S9 family peptidase, partial [Bacteroidota bacterium]
MRLTIIGLSLLLFVQCQNTPSIPGSSEKTPFQAISVQYPEAYRDSSVVDSFGQLAVIDPYRWLENTESASAAAWIEAQNDITQDYIKEIPFRGAIKNRLESLWNYERFSAPRKHGDAYYHFRNSGLQNQDILYRQASLESDPEVVLDPNQLSKDGTTALGDLDFSADGRYMAFELSEAGSDWRNIRIMDLESKQLLPEKIQWVKFSNIAWAGQGFYYSRYPQPSGGNELSGISEFCAVYYHQLGTEQEEDRLVFTDRSRPNRRFRVSTTEDERFLLLSVQESTSG